MRSSASARLADADEDVAEDGVDVDVVEQRERLLVPALRQLHERGDAGLLVRVALDVAPGAREPGGPGGGAGELGTVGPLVGQGRPDGVERGPPGGHDRQARPPSVGIASTDVAATRVGADLRTGVSSTRAGVVPGAVTGGYRRPGVLFARIVHSLSHSALGRDPPRGVRGASKRAVGRACPAGVPTVGSMSSEPSAEAPVPRRHLASSCSVAPAATSVTRPAPSSSAWPASWAWPGRSSPSTTTRELLRRYAEQIPVTFVDGRRHDFWRVDETRLRAALQ